LRLRLRLSGRRVEAPEKVEEQSIPPDIAPPQKEMKVEVEAQVE
jgi:hypothetical protein